MTSREPIAPKPLDSLTDPAPTPAELTNRKLRIAIAGVEERFSGVRAASEAADISRTLEELQGSWRLVVELIDLQPEPERRRCPSCGKAIRRIATRCVHCWKKSSPA